MIWACRCGAEHRSEHVNRRDTFKLAGKLYCCIATFARAANEGDDDD